MKEKAKGGKNMQKHGTKEKNGRTTQWRKQIRPLTLKMCVRERESGTKRVPGEWARKATMETGKKGKGLQLLASIEAACAKHKEYRMIILSAKRVPGEWARKAAMETGKKGRVGITGKHWGSLCQTQQIPDDHSFEQQPSSVLSKFAAVSRLSSFSFGRLFVPLSSVRHTKRSNGQSWCILISIETFPCWKWSFECLLSFFSTTRSLCSMYQKLVRRTSWSLHLPSVLRRSCRGLQEKTKEAI